MSVTFKDGPVITLGECMVEFNRRADGAFTLAYGGDTFNTAVYLARCGARVQFASALGEDDPYSNAITQLARDEGIGVELIHRAPGRMPGLYVIETDARGERSFHYWRERAPVRDLFTGGLPSSLEAATAQASLIYLSGITLSLFETRARDVLAAWLEAAKRQGARIAMDSNFRARGWPEGPEAAQAVFARFWRLADIALPSMEDARALGLGADDGAVAASLAGYGCQEICIKNGAAGAAVATGKSGTGAGDLVTIAPLEAIEPVDTTAAGDSFAAGYLAARLAGHTPQGAAAHAHTLAGTVIQHRGAITPKEATATACAMIAELPSS
ncbi:MAG: sugar kinase [Pseudomonadota bacterium]